MATETDAIQGRVRIETQAIRGQVRIDIWMVLDGDDTLIISVADDAANTAALARTLAMAAEVAETGKEPIDDLTPMERCAIEMCARWIELRGGCNSREEALARARSKILDPARRMQ